MLKGQRAYADDPSGPAGKINPHEQAGDMTAPETSQNSIEPLTKGRRPDMQVCRARRALAASGGDAVALRSTALHGGGSKTRPASR